LLIFPSKRDLVMTSMPGVPCRLPGSKGDFEANPIPIYGIEGVWTWGGFMKRLWMLVLLSGVAFAQAVPAAFSGDNNLLSIPDTSSFEASRVSTPAANSVNPLPDLLPVPQGKATLIGGTIAKTDRVRDEVTIHIFGGGNTRVLFDGRTRIYRDGVAAAPD